MLASEEANSKCNLKDDHYKGIISTLLLKTSLRSFMLFYEVKKLDPAERHLVKWKLMNDMCKVFSRN
jgi:hypothetical protein